MLSRLPFGVLLLDQQGRCLFLNEAAERVINMNDGVSLSAAGRLFAAESSSNARLGRAIHRALAYVVDRTRLPPDGPIALQRNDVTKRYVAFVLPLNRAVVAIGRRVPAAVVFVRDPNGEKTISGKRLEILFDLTAAEAKVAMALCDGASLSSCANQNGISIETARSQLKSVFAKTGVHQQSELVALLFKSLAGLPV